MRRKYVLGLIMVVFSTSICVVMIGFFSSPAFAQDEPSLLNWYADHEILDDQGQCDNSANQDYAYSLNGASLVREPSILRQWALENSGAADVSAYVIESTPWLPLDANPVVDLLGTASIARSGDCSLALMMPPNSETQDNPTAKRGIRIFKRNTAATNGGGMPFDSYYSAWFYLPELPDNERYAITDVRNGDGQITSYGNWNIFQFKNFHSDKDSGNEFFDDSVVAFSFKIKLNGDDFAILHKEAIECGAWQPCRDAVPGSATYDDDISLENRCFKNSPVGGSVTCAPTKVLYYTEAPTIPVGRWFQLQAYITRSSVTEDGTRVNPDGTLAVWIDGKEIFYQSNLMTIVHPDAGQHWSVNNYLNGDVSPLYPTIYVDDAQIVQTAPARSRSEIRNNRLGPNCDPSDGTILAQEAEDGFLAGDFRIRQDGSARNSHYIAVPSNFDSTDGLSENRVDYCFWVNQSGRYRVKGRVRAPSSANNSLWVTVNGYPTGGYVWHTSTSTGFVEDYVASSESELFEVYLEPGPHTVSIYHREADTQLDWLELERVSLNQTLAGRNECGPAPTGLTSSVIEAENGLLTGFMQTAIGDPCDVAIQAADSLPFATHYQPDENYKAEYVVQVPQRGVYQLHAGIRSSNSGSNSFWVAVNDSPASRWGLPISDTYAHAVGPTFELETTNTVTIYAREAETQIDQFWFQCVSGECGDAQAASVGRLVPYVGQFELLLPLVSGEGRIR